MTIEPCRRYVDGHERIGGVCARCGHQDALHPGVPNPTLYACVACVVEVLLRHLVHGGDVPPTPSVPRDLSEEDL